MGSGGVMGLSFFSDEGDFDLAVLGLPLEELFGLKVMVSFPTVELDPDIHT